MAEEENISPIPENEKKSTEAVSNDAEIEEGNSLELQLEKARAEAVENLDNFLRAKAETENIRRRSAEEIIKARKFAVEQFAGELLAVHDSLELASQINSEAGKSLVETQMIEGVTLTLKLLDSAFEKAAITVVDPVGEKFNPELHQAMSMVETDEVEPNHVISVMQKGYLINERLLRPAMVVVAKASVTTEEGEKPMGQRLEKRPVGPTKPMSLQNYLLN